MSMTTGLLGIQRAYLSCTIAVLLGDLRCIGTRYREGEAEADQVAEGAEALGVEEEQEGWVVVCGRRHLRHPKVLVVHTQLSMGVAKRRVIIQIFLPELLDAFAGITGDKCCLSHIWKQTFVSLN